MRIYDITLRMLLNCGRRRRKRNGSSTTNWIESNKHKDCSKKLRGVFGAHVCMNTHGHFFRTEAMKLKIWFSAQRNRMYVTLLLFVVFESEGVKKVKCLSQKENTYSRHLICWLKQWLYLQCFFEEKRNSLPTLFNQKETKHKNKSTWSTFILFFVEKHRFQER